MSVNWNIQQGHKNAAWFTANPTLVLANGQVVHLSGSSEKKYKIGDAVTQLQNLPWNTDHINTAIAAAQSAAEAHADGLVVGLFDDRGNYDASGNTFPASGGSGTAGAILKGDVWTVNVPGSPGGTLLNSGDAVRALVDNPGQTASNWAVTENNFGYTPENQANKNASGGYPGLSGRKIQLYNAAGDVVSTIVSPATSAREWTMPDRSGNIADETMVHEHRYIMREVIETYGGTIKAEPLSGSAVQMTTSSALANQNVRWVPVYLTVSATITGVKWYQQTAGSYTATNFNGVGLYGVDASNGVLTQLAVSADDGNIWKGVGGSFYSKAFTGTVALSPRLYFIALLYCQSAQTTAPVLGCLTGSVNAAAQLIDLTQSIRLGGFTSGQTSLAASYTSSSQVSGATQNFYAALY